MLLFKIKSKINIKKTFSKTVIFMETIINMNFYVVFIMKGKIHFEIFLLFIIKYLKKNIGDKYNGIN